MSRPVLLLSTLLATLCGLLLLAPPQSGAAPPPAAVAALEQLRLSFADMQDFTADITQEKQLAVMKRKLVSTGSVRFKKPDLFYMELLPPHASRMVLRDTRLDLYLVQEKSRQQMSLPGSEGLKRWLGLLARPITSLPEGVEVRVERQGTLQTLTFIPAAKGQVRSFSLTVADNGQLRRLAIDERNGNRTAITFRKLRKNVGLTERDFALD